jgi:hypothetical protein
MTSRYGYAEDGNTAWCVVDYERGGATVSRHHIEQDARAEAARLNAAAGKHETPRLYTEAEGAAREAAAAAEMRAKVQTEEQALARIIVAADLMEQATALGPDWAATMQLGLDRLGLSDALARMLAAERRAGMESAVGIADAVMQQAATCAREPDLIPNIRREYLAQSRGAEDVRDAIRARMESET